MNETGKVTTKMAICYDFDKTLSQDDMQCFEFIPSIGMNATEFWKENNNFSIKNSIDRVLSYMYTMLKKANEVKLPITKDKFMSFGKTIKLYNGVEEWFDLINKFGEQNGVKIEHYIISSGLKEIIQGSSVAPKFKKIYASSFYFDDNGNAVWPAQAINYTTKTQFIYRIAKGVLEEWDESVNEPMDNIPRDTPYENIVYIGDSDTDIPCMRLVNSKGGNSIGVYDPTTQNRDKVLKLLNEKRVNFYAPADYSENGTLMEILKKIIIKVSAQAQLSAETFSQMPSANLYHEYILLKKAFNENGGQLSKKELEILQAYEKQIEKK
ncbi:MAG: HAD family hydrolase [Clostridia bacterium]